MTITMLLTYDFLSDKDILSLLKKLGSLVCATAQTKLPSKSPPFVFYVVFLYFKGDTPLLLFSSFSHSYPVLRS